MVQYRKRNLHFSRTMNSIFAVLIFFPTLIFCEKNEGFVKNQQTRNDNLRIRKFSFRDSTQPVTEFRQKQPGLREICRDFSISQSYQKVLNPDKQGQHSSTFIALLCKKLQPNSRKAKIFAGFRPIKDALRADYKNNEASEDRNFQEITSKNSRKAWFSPFESHLRDVDLEEPLIRSRRESRIISDDRSESNLSTDEMDSLMPSTNKFENEVTTDSLLHATKRFSVSNAITSFTQFPAASEKETGDRAEVTRRKVSSSTRDLLRTTTLAGIKQSTESRKIMSSRSPNAVTDTPIRWTSSPQKIKTKNWRDHTVLKSDATITPTTTRRIVSSFSDAEESNSVTLDEYQDSSTESSNDTATFGDPRTAYENSEEVIAIIVTLSLLGICVAIIVINKIIWMCVAIKKKRALAIYQGDAQVHDNLHTQEAEAVEMVVQPSTGEIETVNGHHEAEAVEMEVQPSNGEIEAVDQTVEAMSHDEALPMPIDDKEFDDPIPSLGDYENSNRLSTFNLEP